MALESPPSLIDVVTALREQGLTQQQIATKIGAEHPYVSKLLLISGLEASSDQMESVMDDGRARPVERNARSAPSNAQ
jgi:predicted XRE-type DNA-binding protein